VLYANKIVAQAIIAPSNTILHMPFKKDYLYSRNFSLTKGADYAILDCHLATTIESDQQ